MLPESRPERDAYFEKPGSSHYLTGQGFYQDAAEVFKIGFNRAAHASWINWLKPAVVRRKGKAGQRKVTNEVRGSLVSPRIS